MSDDLQAFALTDDIARQHWPDIAIPVTFFTDVHARTVDEWPATPRVLTRVITQARARAKDKLPLLKLARFGTKASKKGSLRHDRNVIAVTGIEADYDGEQVSFETACATLRQAGVASIVYTSPSHTDEKPRWRVLAPFITEQPPAEHKRMMSRLAGLFAKAGAMFSPESWALSQAYYYGGIVNGADHAPRVELIEGITIERCDDLDDTATAQPGSTSTAQGQDGTRSAAAFRLGAKLRREGANFEQMCEAIRIDPATADWYREKGEPNDGRELHRIWEHAGDDGKRRRNTLALVAHLSAQDEWQGAVANNELTENKETTMRFSSHGDRIMRPLTDADVLEAMLWAQANGFPKASKGMVLDALTIIANRNAYHPIRDYLNALKWDGTERVGKLFIDYFGAELPRLSDHPSDEEQTTYDRHVAYLEQAGPCFLLSAVARVMEPGCKVDTVPVLIGKQGIGKSTALRALCHDPAWFSDDISPNLIERDTKESLRGKWIVELAEVPHVRREAERVKAFFSRREDRYRAAYGLLTRDHPRQCVFIGTSNDLEFVDTSGNRRFWPVRLGDNAIDIQRIIADRDQLWAQALHLYRQGMQWWLPPNIELIATEVQDDFVEHDLWEDLITRWAKDRLGPFTMDQLFAAADSNGLGGGFMPFREAAAATKADQMRAAACLKRLGYSGGRTTVGGRRGYWWRKKRKSVGT